jgi:lipopolysaccharide export system ATP-binding protein|tara:strand:+ start:242 stop:976 length:735 start_codon:yes stop_codon:yes gene_type:complete
MPILEASGLVKSFRRRRVVNGISLRVEVGEIVGLLGVNGAGKTTSFKMICGMLPPDSGRVFLKEQDVTNWPMYKRSRECGMGYLAQESSVFQNLSVEQNLIMMIEMQNIKGKKKKEFCNELLERFNITKIRKTKAGKISGGERRRLEIARCLVSKPEIVMLDEPFSGVDPITVQSIQVTIESLRNEGISILITDHAVREMLEIVDRGYVVAAGEVMFQGTPQEIWNNEDVRRKYLGNMEELKSV